MSSMTGWKLARGNAVAREMLARKAQRDLDKKMDFKIFAGTAYEVPKVLRRFSVLLGGSIKDDLSALKGWVCKDDADAVHPYLEELHG
ncbi:unnamed protein product [Symbiodinium natans]|uniref:Uncharacterized protein n=1 Tax=Symbiodinium natans TaxID=878477 RepID=A0A812TCN2_9DINO|nr:unnamed protein product [Symbiodinium natans]